LGAKITQFVKDKEGFQEVQGLQTVQFGAINEAVDETVLYATKSHHLTTEETRDFRLPPRNS